MQMRWLQFFFYGTDVSRKEEYLKTDGNNDMNEFTED
jgi:hypothetical protein